MVVESPGEKSLEARFRKTFVHFLGNDQAEYLEPGDAGLATPEKDKAAHGDRGEAGDTADLIGIDCIADEVQAGTNENAEGLPPVVCIAVGGFFLAEEDDGNRGGEVDGSEGAQIAARGWTRWSFLTIGVS